MFDWMILSNAVVWFGVGVAVVNFVLVAFNARATIKLNKAALQLYNERAEIAREKELFRKARMEIASGAMPDTREYLEEVAA